MVARQQQALGLPGIGVAGDFADMNPRYSKLAGPGALVSGSQGVYVGRFGWISLQTLDPDNAGVIVNNFGSGVPNGFIPRSGQLALITQYLAASTMLIQQGAPLWMAVSGGFLVQNDGATQALIGQKAYASLTTGMVNFAPTGAPIVASGITGDVTVAAGTWSATGSITGNVMTVGVVTGAEGVAIGSLVTGASVAPGTTVVRQLTGAVPRAAGTYAVSIGEQTVASTALTATFGVLTVVGSPSGGVIVLNSLVAGTGIPTGSIVTDTLANGNTNLTGAGAAGTYVTNLTGSGGSGVVTFTVNVETKWYADSSGAVGELVKMSDITQ